ncbi:MAG: hypothetical protein OEY23_22680 [Acidimicrobiia bacterium]|nr:hypothetical protein [Acidimicrobiia bacterium]
MDDTAASMLTAELAALRTGVGAVELARDVVRASGPDAATFLQGQLSQDVAGLAVASSAWTLLLEPQGRLTAWLRVTRTADDAFLLDVEAGHAEAVVARLSRFKIRTRCELDVLDGWRMVALRGPGSSAVDLTDIAAEVVADAGWPEPAGVDLVGPGVTTPAGVLRCSPLAYDIVRIEAGVPAMGHDLDERVIPAEAGIVEGSVSFTKGCYTGQELVARLDSRGGNVARRLRRLEVDGPALPPRGAALVGAGGEVGRLTSVAATGAAGGGPAAVALGYVHRSVEPPASLVARWDGGEAAVSVKG